MVITFKVFDPFKTGPFFQTLSGSPFCHVCCRFFRKSDDFESQLGPRSEGPPCHFSSLFFILAAQGVQGETRRCPRPPKSAHGGAQGYLKGSPAGAQGTQKGSWGICSGHGGGEAAGQWILNICDAVSYTHLTLPTKRIV